jgi:hypothetical protein
MSNTVVASDARFLPLVDQRDTLRWSDPAVERKRADDKQARVLPAG